MVGLERTAYTVSEDVVVVELCAIVFQPNGGLRCPINFDFDIILSTDDATAGKPVTHPESCRPLKAAKCCVFEYIEGFFG